MNHYLLLLVVVLGLYQNVGFPQNNWPEKRTETSSLIYKVEVNTTDWNWKVSLNNNSEYNVVLLRMPVMNGIYSYFSLYDSSLHKIDRVCLFVNNVMTPVKGRKKKKMGAESEGVKIGSDSLKEFDGGKWTLQEYFCRVDPSNHIQFTFKSPLRVYDRATNKLIKEIDLNISTRMMRANENKLLQDSVVIEL